MVCYSGINTDLSDEEALEACVEGLKPLLDIAEKANVTLVMELLSSRNTEEIFTKQRFSYYQCDNPEWGVALCKKLNSPNFKLLYDVWHMNDMGRDIMSDIKNIILIFLIIILRAFQNGKDLTGQTPLIINSS